MLGIPLPKFFSMQPNQSHNVTILNRSYPSGRHIVNAEAIAQEIRVMDGINDCRSKKPFVSCLSNLPAVQMHVLWCLAVEFNPLTFCRAVSNV